MSRSRWKVLTVLFATASLVTGCGPGTAQPLPPLSARMRGMTEAGYTGSVFSSPPVLGQLPILRRDGVDWLAIQTAWYQRTDTSDHIFPDPAKTPTDASVTALIAAAHRNGMRVFLNPFVNSLQGNGWQANFHPRSVTAWFHSFDQYLAHYAKLAQQDHADLFAIGDEFQSLDAVPAYKPDWLHAIAVARRYYHGPITYGANYPDYQQVTFWHALNDIGVDAYFPLSSAANPTLPALRASWTAVADNIAAWRRASGLANKPFLITELGYPSEDGAAAAPGTWFPDQPTNLRIQELCYLATFQSIWRRPWLRGIFWFWWANPSNPHWLGGPTDNGYTPRGKPAMEVLIRYFTGKTGSVAKHKP
jgi:hypothetical protein